MTKATIPKYKRIPWWEPRIGNYEYPLIQKVLKSNFPNEGQLTREFEEEIGKLLGVKYVLAVTSATAAMFLSLKALGIGLGDEVIVPDLTFISTANAVEMTGAKPVFADIDPVTLTLSIESFKKAITKRTKAVIPVHVSGRPASITEICKIAKKNHLFVIEDAAEAFMSKFQNKFLGTFGQTGCFSLSPAKTITTGQGGLITTNSKKLYRILKELKDQGRPKRGTGGDDIHYSIGYNFKFTDLQAAVGLGQLHYLKKRIEKIKRTYQLYRKYLNGIGGIRVLEFKVDKGELPQWVDAIVDERDMLDDYLKKYAIDCRKFWHPIHKQKPYRQDDKMFPNSSELSPKALWLPSAFTLTDSDIKKVCSYIIKFLKTSYETKNSK